MNEVAVVIPTLGRAGRLDALLDSIAETTEGEAHVYLVVEDTGSALVGERRGASVLRQGGTAPQKWNAGYRFTADEPFVCAAADDVLFRSRWWEAARVAFGDPAVGVVGTYDRASVVNPGRNVTIPIFRRTYIEDPGAAWQDPGVIYHEGYEHGYVDREAWQLARARGVAAFAKGSVIEHFHPDLGNREPDATDQKRWATDGDADERLFAERQREWQGVLGTP